MSERAAWFCPACQKHHAPHVETCPAPVDLIGRPLKPVQPWMPERQSPYYPEWMKGTTADPCASCSGACGNAFCPKRAHITCAAGALPISECVSYSIGTACQ